MEKVKERRSYWEDISYFIFYSFMGCVLETGFGLLTKGVIESRQSFLWGPFCIIYGIGAILILWSCQKWKGKLFQIFLVSSCIGTIVEFSMSYFCEIIFHFKWWDYSNMKFNLAGRTCLYFSMMWGILGLLLINFVHPLVSEILKLIKNYVNMTILKVSIALILGFLILDASVSYVGLKSFYAKVVRDFDMDLKTKEYPTVYVENPLFQEDTMLFIYPNMQIAGTKYNNTYIDSLYRNKKMYYVKIFAKE